MRDRLIKLFATGFCTGLVPVAPGTFGSVLGVGYWWLLVMFNNTWLYWGITLAGIVTAVWVAGAAAKLYGDEDPSCVVIDEIVAVPVALAFVVPVWWAAAIGFVFFRLFDVWKPWPVRQSQALPGGWGIVVDDVLAAGYACGLTHAVVWLLSRF
jgi:phosphatidylglycerophosphatase A